MFDWNNFLVLADNLLRSEGDEACLRSAVSRAYYAVYHRAQMFAISKNNILLQDIIRTEHSKHLSLQKFFIDDSDPSLRQLGVNLSRLHKKRVKCDYEDFQITEENAQFSVAFAKSIMGKIPTI